MSCLLKVAQKVLYTWLLPVCQLHFLPLQASRSEPLLIAGCSSGVSWEQVLLLYFPPTKFICREQFCPPPIPWYMLVCQLWLSPGVGSTGGVFLESAALGTLLCTHSILLSLPYVCRVPCHICVLTVHFFLPFLKLGIMRKGTSCGCPVSAYSV